MKYFYFIKGTFSGRIGRGDYFAGDILLMFTIFLIVAFTAITAEIIPKFNVNVDVTLMFIVATVFILILNVVIIWLGLNVRRLHDFGYSGWTLLLAFIPIVNMVIGLMALFKAGNSKENEYGDVPDENKNLIKRVLNISTNKKIEITRNNIESFPIVEINFCTSCGKETELAMKFCKFCGNKLIQ